jgi:Sulfotransferase family
MVISHRYRYLYFVVPKCASATVRQSLAPFTDIGYPVTRHVQHQSIRQFLATPHQPLYEQGYFRFTFVRNPYDRLYSGYVQDRFAATQNSRWQRAKESIFKSIGDDFNRYLREHVRHAEIESAWDWICFCPMREFAYLDGTCVLDFIGRAESVEADLTELARRLRAPITKAADVNVKVVPRPGLKYLDRYDRATLEMVNELYADDFRLFGYEMVDPSGFPLRAAAA